MTRPAIRAAIAAVGFVLLAGGCYQRTVSTNGIGTSGVTTQESYRSNTAADRWVDQAILGKREPAQPGWKRSLTPR